MKKLIYMAFLLLATAGTIYAEDFAVIRKLASDASRVTISEGITIEGVIISDRTSLNMADNANSAWNTIDLAELRNCIVDSI